MIIELLEPNQWLSAAALCNTNSIEIYLHLQQDICVLQVNSETPPLMMASGQVSNSAVCLTPCLVPPKYNSVVVQQLTHPEKENPIHFCCTRIVM